jgi:N-acetylmuramoyl-L-alanine amidase
MSRMSRGSRGSNVRRWRGGARSPERNVPARRLAGLALALTALGALAGCAQQQRSGTPAAAAAAAALVSAPTTPIATPGTSTQGSTGSPAGVPSPLPLAGRTITVDPGHNGGNFTHPREIARLVPDGNGEKECDTTGTAAPDGYRETDFNWAVAVRLRALLQAAGARVVMTRENNTGVGPCVDERAAIGNRAHSSAAISIHADGGPPDGSGFAILIPAPIPGGGDDAIIGPSRHLGIDMRTALLGIGLPTSTYDGLDGLAPRTNLGGLNLSRVPKVFVEVANMQNAADEAPLPRPAFQERVARALLRGFELFLAPRA